jgi:hypothetical protein
MAPRSGSPNGALRRAAASAHASFPVVPSSHHFSYTGVTNVFSHDAAAGNAPLGLSRGGLAATPPADAGGYRNRVPSGRSRIFKCERARKKREGFVVDFDTVGSQLWIAPNEAPPLAFPSPPILWGRGCPAGRERGWHGALSGGFLGKSQRARLLHAAWNDALSPAFDHPCRVQVLTGCS